MSETQPTPELKKPAMTQAEFGKFILGEARAQINYQITGSDRIYDASDPTVEEAFNKRVDQALQKGEYIDAQGRRCKTPGLGRGLDSQTSFHLATERMKRMVELLKADQGNEGGVK